MRQYKKRPIDLFEEKFPEWPGKRDKSLFLESDSFMIMMRGDWFDNDSSSRLIASRYQISDSLTHHFGLPRAHSQVEKIVKTTVTPQQSRSKEIVFSVWDSTIF